MYEFSAFGPINISSFQNSTVINKFEFKFRFIKDIIKSNEVPPVTLVSYSITVIDYCWPTTSILPFVKLQILEMFSFFFLAYFVTQFSGRIVERRTFFLLLPFKVFLSFYFNFVN